MYIVYFAKLYRTVPGLLLMNSQMYVTDKEFTEINNGRQLLQKVTIQLALYTYELR